ncbi:class I SAM-dependent methyltransferase [Massilia glaciei]|uniref:Class I SAM-dependent methyltransferase n=1 Tax=Massilia glaciei TaxID=1524097 RepID=A0A2U2HF20_9BURK|nr:class I SAM-dependent methyltransferase [Massilia glaciei]PWF42503.1 class I SAM-dependent methyltransferase [Massilia glaciei]
MASQVDTREAVWSRYWSHGVAHSCGGSYGNRYEGALARHWRDAFGALAPGARALDIATGNGALPRLLLDFDPDGALSCDAVDLATPAPQWLEALPAARRARLRFHGGVAAEALPFADAQFDLVMSQYGLEYTELARSVPEILRVLAPGGRVALVAHHREARPVLLAEAELGHLEWLARPHGLLETAAALLGPMALAATEEGRAALAADAAANAARARFNELQKEATGLAAASACPDALLETREALGAILGIASGQGAPAAREAMGALRAELADSALRLRELRHYALDEAGARRLCADLAGAGGAATLDPILDQAVLMGWAISAAPAP